MTIRTTLRPGLAAMLLLHMVGIGPAYAEAPDEAAARAAEACTWSHTGGQLAAVLCEPGLEQAVWAAAGRAACTGQALCGAWIYDDPGALPDPMPASFEGLTQANVTSAVAVWVAEGKYLVIIAPAD
jgi:hypothetical protein